ncbi:Maf family protein [Actibacterium lipolyticum]|uniref:Nucleoside triphosphate pyrophosphatase n=1 Tax=Actibacterium lipolyticum TaxID=1524263 RepID=A0A238KWP3_9RHOB|nr:Maf family nucleotide pyrophosphatase [Actibacterium lipolyticum]SMX47108.1 Maf-like protein YceF [Actibacterium lipolyticum]
MSQPIILASSSEIRQQMLRQAGVEFEVLPSRIDEEAIRAALEAEEANPRDIADALAEFKARKIADKFPDRMVIGCDQVLELKGKVMSKPTDLDQARVQLRQLRANRHKLLSAAVIYDEGKPVWRHVGEVRLTMRPFSDSYMEDYLARNWESVQHSVGCYKLEEEGVRLFSRVEGDYFTVLGLPLLELLSYLTMRGKVQA